MCVRPSRMQSRRELSEAHTFATPAKLMLSKLPVTSCNGNPVNLGERSKIKMIRRAVSRQNINLFRGDAIIPF